MKTINSALISVYNKYGLDPILEKLHDLGIDIISTGGTHRYIEEKGYKATKVESITAYPSILGGRVKTLHPQVFGGILARREDDEQEIKDYEIPLVDLVIVDLYPFEETLENSKDHEEIIEKIDIGGIALIRAAAKNYKDVLVIPSRNSYEELFKILDQKGGHSAEDTRKKLAARAFKISSQYDRLINDYLDANSNDLQTLELGNPRKLRYGENPHQEGYFYGKLEDVFEQMSGKEISFNNLVDIDAATNLSQEFDQHTFTIVKHTNPCGVATRENLDLAWDDALQGDPVSAFGGILATTSTIDATTASKINELFFEVIIAADYDNEALEILKQKGNRIILKKLKPLRSSEEWKSMLNGFLYQDKDRKIEKAQDLEVVTNTGPSNQAVQDLLFANKIVKHTKSNAIVLVKNMQLVGIGMGQTSRVDGLKQAIHKAHQFGFDLNDAVMASDAFFPFYDSVQIAEQAGISSVIQPGGSKRDEDSIDYCNNHGMAMVFTGTRHFKH